MVSKDTPLSKERLLKSACRSDRRWAVAMASRNTVLSVSRLRSQEAIGSLECINEESSTIDRSHLGVTCSDLGRTTNTLLKRDVQSSSHRSDQDPVILRVAAIASL